jgi:ubiquitin carboxyl-terminal hydrolase 48
MDRLDYSLSDERLEGENQYHCQACGTKRDATRSAAISNLPPILHFSLLRFVFDPKTYDRRKSRASITFPRQLDLGGHSYHLQAIITHSGPSAHEGHFVCEAQDQATGSWYMCDDEDVSQINRSRTVHEDMARQASGSGSGRGSGSGLDSEPPTKRARTDDDTLRSKDAYMLVYTRLGQVEPIPPPNNIMRKVDLELAEWYNEQGRQEVEKYILEDEYQGLAGAKKQVARVLPGMECLIPKSELERWFNAQKVDDLFKPWNIPVCSHGDVDPDSTGLFKLVSLEAFELLQRYGFDIPERYTAEKTMSKGKEEREEVIDLSQSPPPAAEELPTIDSNINGPALERHSASELASAATLAVQVEQVNGANGMNGADGMIVTNGEKEPTQTNWTPGNILQDSIAMTSTGSLPRAPSRNGSNNVITSSSKVEKSSADMSRTPSSQPGIQTFSILPRMTICPICVEAEYHSRSAPQPSKEDKESWKAETKLDRQIMKSLDPKFVIFDSDYYYLPDSFVEPWLEFTQQDSAPRPILAGDLGRCEHGMLAVDLEMDEIHLIDQKGWDQVVQK